MPQNLLLLPSCASAGIASCSANKNERTHLAQRKLLLFPARINYCGTAYYSSLHIRCKGGGRTSFRNTRHVHHSGKEGVGMIMRSLNAEGANVASTLDFHSRFLQLADWFCLLEEICKQDKWPLALETFRWMQQQKWYKADDGFYAKLISILGKKGQTRLAVWLFAEMKRNGCRPDTSVYNSLIAAHVRNKDKEQALLKAFSYLEIMKQKPRCKPNIVTYNILTRACAQVHLFDKVDEFFIEMQAAGIEADAYTFNGILDAYGKSSLFLEMESTLRNMIENKCKPDVITYNVLIDAYGKGYMVEKMEQSFRSMIRAKVKPTLPTFNSLIHNYGRLGFLEKMKCVFEEMAEVDVAASNVTYELLMSGYANAGDLAEMRNCLRSMIQAGTKPQLSTINVLLTAYCSQGLLDEAERLLSNARQMSITPTAKSYLIVLKEYIKHKCFDKIEMMIRNMELEGIEPRKALVILKDYGWEPQREKLNMEGASCSSG